MVTASTTPDRFPLCLPLTLAYEGGWANHPLDPGKATMRGVTQAVYDDYRSMHGVGVQSVRHISDSELTSIYRWRYWDAIRAGSLPIGVDYAMFDFAVNSGVRRSVLELQAVLDVRADGSIGPLTLAAVASFCRGHGNASLSDAVCARRLRFIRGLSTYETFGRGWTARIVGSRSGSQVDDTGVADRALRMIVGDVATVPAAPANTPKTFAAAA